MQFGSSAAAALAAAASANVSTTAAGPRAAGRRLQGADIKLDVDVLRDGETVSELQVQPITLLKLDYKLEHTQQVAISNSYICYGLKPGHIRALNRNTANRALFKGHPTTISHMAFFNPENNLLASASCHGDITVRLVTDAPGPDAIVPAETIMMTAQLPLPTAADAAGTSALVKLAWHPFVSQILAAGAAGTVYIFEVPSAAPAEQPSEPMSPGIQYSLPGAETAAVTAIAFSPSGDLLLAADSTGSVHAWLLEGDDDSVAPQLTWQPFGSSSGGVASVHFLHQAADGSSLLLTGNATNATVKLWALPAAAAVAGTAPVCLQTVSFTTAKGQEDVFCHIVVQPELQLVVLANTVRKQVYTLHYVLSSTEPAGATFDYAAFFSAQYPILSLTTGLEAVESQEVPGEMQLQQLLLYTVQTDAIQQYVINPALCSSTEIEEKETEVEPGEEVSSSAPAAPEAALVASEPAAAADAATLPAGEVGTPEAPVAASVPPPAQLPTPGKLLHAITSEQETAAAAAEQAAAVTSELPETTAEESDTTAVSMPAADVAMGSEPEAAESAAAASAADATEQDRAEEAAAAATPPAETNAAPAELLQERQDAASGTAAASSAAPLPPMPTTSLLHSAEKALAAAVAATPPADVVPEARAPEGAAPVEAESKVLPANGVEAAAEAAEPAATEPEAAVAPAELAALQQQMQQLLVMQQELAAQLQANSQQTVKGVKTALKATESALSKQIDSSIKASAKKVEDDRRGRAAKERSDMEKLIRTQLEQVTAPLQVDLLKAVANIAREQSRSTVTAVVNSVPSIVAQAVTTALQKELLAGGAGGSQLQIALERSLSSTLAGPLHEALRENFAASIIPAFERATQVMFGQVETAFTSWLSESSRTVASAQSDAAASLNNSLQQLQQVVGTMRGELADTSRSLNRIASSTASRAAEGAAGAGARSVSQIEAGAAADPRIEIGALLGVRKYEDALVKALNTASLDVLLWACKQVDPALVLSGSSVSQTTLLSLVHQLSVDLKSDANTPIRLAWLTEAAPVLDPHDPVTSPHLKSVLTGVMNSLKQLVNSLPSNDAMSKKGRVTLHLFNSLLHQ